MNPIPTPATTATPDPATTSRRPLTLGFFDSGFGGLTVLRAMLPLLRGSLANTRCLYLGDSARLPYGSKSQQTIARYAVSSADFLQHHGADLLVIACNTASALALPQIRAASRVPVLGVIETGAAAADACSRSKSVLVLGTTATIASHAYAAELANLGLHATEKACPLLVPLVEEGWIDHTVTDEVVRIYLHDALREAAQYGAARPDTLLLGCTHYPLLREVFARHLPPAMAIVDTADVTATRAAQLLTTLQPQHPQPPESDLHPPDLHPPDLHFYVTDSPTQFQHLGSRFLGREIAHVQHVQLPE